MTESSENAAYRAYVGPADQYDLIGGAQFALLFALGLREQDRCWTSAVDRCGAAGC